MKMTTQQAPKLLIDINKILCGVITTESGATVRIDSSLVRPRFKEQIAIFAEKWDIFNKAKKKRDKQKLDDSRRVLKDKRYRIENVSPPKEGLIWQPNFALCVPGRAYDIGAWVRPTVNLPPDPTNWEIGDELPCAYAVLTTIHDQAETESKKRIHVGIWSEYLYAWMILCVERYDDGRIEKAFDIVKNVDLATKKTTGEKPSADKKPRPPVKKTIKQILDERPDLKGNLDELTDILNDKLSYWGYRKTTKDCVKTTLTRIGKEK